MSRRRVASALVALLLVGAVTAWWLVPRSVSGPPRGAHATAPPAPGLSVVSIPIELPLAELQASMEASIPQVFAEQHGEELSEGARMDLDARRAGPLSLTGSNGALHTEVPVSVTVKVYSARRADSRASKGKEAPAGATVTANLVLHVETAYELTDDWALRSTTHVSHRWRSRPTVAIGPLRVGVERLADKALNDQWGPMGAQIDARQAEDTSVRDGLSRAWTDLSTPRQVADDPPTWFVGSPEALFATSPTVDADAIRLTVGLRGRFAMVVGDPGPAAPVAALPPRADPPAEAGFRLAVPVQLDWPTLSATATTRLAGTTWSSPVGTATVDAVELYPSGDLVVVALRYEADHAWKTEGTLYMWGRPVVDREARVLHVADFEFGAGTTLGEVVQEQLAFPFGEQIDAAKARFEQGLTRRTAGQSLHGTVATLDLGDVRLTDEAVVVDAVATGTLSLTVVPDGRHP